MKAKTFSLVLFTAFLLCGVLLALPVNQQRASAASLWYVAPGGNDANDCLSPDTACATITAAIGKSISGDTVMVMPGSYNQASGETFPISPKPGTHLIGSGRDSTIISGPGYGNVILFDGFTQDYFNDTSLENLNIQDGAFGILLLSSGSHTTSPKLSGLKIQGNQFGINIFTQSHTIDGGTIAPVITDTLITSNSTKGISMEAYAPNTDSAVNPTIENSIIEGNGTIGIEIFAYAENNHNAIAAPKIIHSQVINNGSDGIYVAPFEFGLANPTIEQSWIDNNNGLGINSVRITYSNFNVAITNTVIAENQIGGVYILDQSDENSSSFRIVNSNIQYNQNYGISWDGNPLSNFRPAVVNSILWNPSADDLTSFRSTWSVGDIGYSDIADGHFQGQNGNFSAYPLFWDQYHLTSCSPAVDAGTTSAMPLVDIDGDPRPAGLGPDVGVDEQAAPCRLSVDKQVSDTEAHLGDTLAYTITLSPTDVITPFSMVLTDTIPQALTLEPDSLWASQGDISHAGNTVLWQGTISPTIPISIGFKANTIQVNTTAQNYALINAQENGLYRSPTVTTMIGFERQFLSFIRKSPLPQGIYGKVTDDGQPAAGVLLYLRFYDGSSWSTKATQYTSNDGSYSFLNQPSLNPGQLYYVLYQNSPDTYNAHLWTWHTRQIESYVGGTDYHIGDFDIRDVFLLLPFNDTMISLPYPFQWTMRPNTPSDSYEFDIFDPYDGDPYFYTNPLGYVNSYTLTNLPPGFNPNTLYAWEVWVYSPDGGYGISFELRAVYFSGKSLGAIPGEQLPPLRQMPDLENRLWRLTP